ncbi:MAG: complex I NDUFA9 subunit family protein [Micavibrio aeruginosavorus]|uniref:Complex I NDUFA9 subunit family protein n=1 Tax=Micavibrio aeruginosavorus TaxID=349221 RepID=A0A2W5FQ32_9BACT|nr:MAG: complex I NDUFA9 subunit family protein [Micavibrio aeruginosavorus]
MNLQNKIITIFGGTGFVGRYIVARLAKHGATIKVVTRSPSSGYFLRQFGVVGQIVPVACDYSENSISHAVSGSDIVINCLGILFEKGKSNFKTVHVDDASMIARACAIHAVKRLVHISALGIDESKSKYAGTKREGEKAVRGHFSAATIIRPSVIFGPEDNFFNKFASLSLLMPALPLIARGNTKFQPVYVGDVADAIAKALMIDASTAKTYELGGPEVLNFKEIYQKLFAQIGHKRILVNMPESIARIQAALFSILPTPPLTGDQITSLKTDNVVSENALKLRDLAIHPTALDAILPSYLNRYRSGGRFAEKKRA